MIRSFPPKLCLSAAVYIPLPLIGPLRLVGDSSCRLPSKIVAAAQLTLLADNAPLFCTAGDELEPMLPEGGDNSLETPDLDDEDDSDEDEDDGISTPSSSR